MERDLNGYVGKENKDYNELHGGFGFGNRNDERRSILDFTIAYDLMVTDTFFQRKMNT